MTSHAGWSALRRGGAVLAVSCAIAGAATAQSTQAPTTPPEIVKPAQPDATGPNAITPPGGIARGVIEPPHSVDPAMVTPPPAPASPSMPIIKPPGTSR